MTRAADPSATDQLVEAAPPAAAPPVEVQGRHPVRGLIAQIAGITGLIVCLLLIAVVWLGRGWVVDGIDGLTTSLDDDLARGVAATTAATSKVDALAGEIGTVSDQA